MVSLDLLVQRVTRVRLAIQVVLDPLVGLVSLEMMGLMVDPETLDLRDLA